MNRRELIAAGVAAALPRIGRAQPAPLPIVGFLHSAAPGQLDDLVGAFRSGLKEAGFVEGQNIAIEYRWADNDYERLPGLAADLVSRKVQVIATGGGDRSAVAAKQTTSAIPIVSVIGGDPVATGLVASLARPGGNLTGVSFLTASLTPKRFELLLGLVPQAKRVALLVNPKNPQTPGVVDDLRRVVQAKGLAFDSAEASNPEQIDTAFAGFKQSQASMLIVESDPFFNARGDQFIGLTASSSLPAIYERRTFVAAGGLISYGTSLADVYRGVAAYVGKILNGAKPAELPMLQPTKFDLAINLKTAKGLGLTVPPSLLVGADEVIE